MAVGLWLQLPYEFQLRWQGRVRRQTCLVPQLPSLLRTGGTLIKYYVIRYPKGLALSVKTLPKMLFGDEESCSDRSTSVRQLLLSSVHISALHSQVTHVDCMSTHMLYDARSYFTHVSSLA